MKFKTLGIILFVALSSQSVNAAVSLTVCGGLSQDLSLNQEDGRVWEKVDLSLDLEERTLSYDRYIGIFGHPEKSLYRELTQFEKFKINNPLTRDSGKFIDLQELDPNDVTSLIVGVDPRDVLKLYRGETYWTGKSGFLITLKDGTTIFSSGMVYSSKGNRCQFTKN